MPRLQSPFKREIYPRPTDNTSCERGASNRVYLYLTSHNILALAVQLQLFFSIYLQVPISLIEPPPPPLPKAMSSPAPKRLKVDAALDIVSASIFESEEILRQAYLDAKPYRHGRLENMFQPGFLGTYFSIVVRREHTVMPPLVLFARMYPGSEFQVCH